MQISLTMIYTSVKSRRFVRSLLRAETFAIYDACDAAIFLQTDLKSIRNMTIKIKLLADRATLFNIMVEDVPTTETFL